MNFEHFMWCKVGEKKKLMCMCMFFLKRRVNDYFTENQEDKVC